MVDNPALEAGAVRHESSSLSRRTWSLTISKLIAPLTALGKDSGVRYLRYAGSPIVVGEGTR